MNLLRCAVLLAAGCSVAAAGADIPTLAAAYGARPAAWGVRLSPDGGHVLYMAPTGTSGNTVIVADVATGETRSILTSDGALFDLRACDWKSDVRIICTVAAIRFAEKAQKHAVGIQRTLSLAADGSSRIELGYLEGAPRSTGGIVDMLPDDPQHILMGYCRFDIETNRRSDCALPPGRTFDYATDGRGKVRYRTVADYDPNGYLRSTVSHQIQPKGENSWTTIGFSKLTGIPEFAFLGFDEAADNVLVAKPVDGRQALYRMPATNAKTSELLFAHPQVDIDGVLRIGKFNRPVAAAYTLDSTHYHYFDSVLDKRSEALSKALPGAPPVAILDESWDGRYNLVLAGGEHDGGTYYRFDTKTRQLGQLVKVRPDLEAYTAATETRVDYPGDDGVKIPAYLTMPPGRPRRGLPAIVMPHGGPAARDQLGFDYLAQYFAQLGYVVLKPNFRGSTGYGAAWYQDNGFRSWRTAIADINAGARWLVAQGIADPARLAILGWSYGGYAALQANVAQPDLYRAVVAIAPVTDLKLLIKDQSYYSSYTQSLEEFAQGQDADEGSPSRHADRIKAPVLIFQGTKDLNVDQEHAKRMDAALTKAGKTHQLVLYPDLDHQLDDSKARADMLAKSAEWLAK